VTPPHSTDCFKKQKCAIFDTWIVRHEFYKYNIDLTGLRVTPWLSLPSVCVRFWVQSISPYKERKASKKDVTRKK
jgi:hypothetical protein